MAAPVSSITLDGDLGCDTLRTQRERTSALKVSMQTGVTKAQGKASPAMLKLNETATAKFVELSRNKCRRLAGPFDAIERQPFAGGSIVRVGFGSGSLWVLMK